MKLAHVPLALAVLAALALVVASGYGARFGIWDFRFGFSCCAGACTRASLSPRWRSSRSSSRGFARAGLASLAAALVIGLGVAYFPWHWLQRRARVPPINDITTDTGESARVRRRPSAARRRAGVRRLSRARDRAQQQRALSGHPPGRSRRSAGRRIRSALDAAKSFGWEIDATDAASGPDRGDRNDAVVRLSGRRRDPRDADAERQPRRHPLAVARRQEAISAPTPRASARISPSSRASDSLEPFISWHSASCATTRSKTTLAAGGCAFGAMIFEFFAPGIPQICRNAGADFVLYDMEHTGLGFETLKTQFALCRGLAIVPMVRVPRGEYHFIARALDVGAMGVMVPMVGTPEEAAHIVACTRYPPQGRRGAAFGFAHDDYAGRRRRGEDRGAQRANDGDPADRDRRGPRQRRARSPRCRASTRSGSGISISRTSWEFPASSSIRISSPPSIAWSPPASERQDARRFSSPTTTGRATTRRRAFACSPTASIS